MAADINADGSLVSRILLDQSLYAHRPDQTLASAVATGGLGEHGNVTGADPLYSQGAVVVNTNTSLLATVNVLSAFM